MKRFFPHFVAFLLTFSLGFLLSYHSIPNQEGYAENYWNLSHVNFTKFILYPNVTPFNFLGVMLIEKLVHLSLANSWKFFDLFCGGLTAAFLFAIYEMYYKPNSFKESIIGILFIVTSFGFTYNLTSMTGEGLPVLTAVVGTYFWQKKRFFPGIVSFIISLLAKYTIYLIGPGIFVWTLINWKSFARKEKKQIILSGISFLVIFFLYHSIKQFGDLTVQGQYAGWFTIQRLTVYLPAFILGILLGAPLATIAFIKKFTLKNIYSLCTISALILLTRHYFFWHYPLQIIPFIMLFVLSEPQLKSFLNVRTIGLQIILFFCLCQLLPITLSDLVLFHKHIKTDEMNMVQAAILKNYHNGTIGYYQNRKFDEPYHTIELGYLEKENIGQIETFEYVVTPKDLFPYQFAKLPNCSWTLDQVIGSQNIYKIDCPRK